MEISRETFSLMFLLSACISVLVWLTMYLSFADDPESTEFLMMFAIAIIAVIAAQVTLFFLVRKGILLKNLRSKSEIARTSRRY